MTLKDRATQALAAMGLSMSDAVRLFLRRVVMDQAFPLELKAPNAETQAAIEESRVMMSKRKARFADTDAPMGAEWMDHVLKGEWADHRECHIGGDFLLIYQAEVNAIDFVRSGTHSELFSKS